MKIVIDSNRVIAALIKDSTTREILFNKNFEFFAPEFIENEIEKYKEEILNKAGIPTEEFEILLSLVFEHISIISQSEYNSFFEESEKYTNDPKDIAYFSVCSLIKAKGIWTHDPHFLKQKKYKIFTNIDMIKFINN